MHTRSIRSLTVAAIATLVATNYRTPAKDIEPPAATKDAPFINTLGLGFVPVPGTKVLFCRTETRVKDFEAYCKAAQYKQKGGMIVWKVKQKEDGSQYAVRELDENANWREPDFEQRQEHPVAGVNWDEARAFCAWLSKKEDKEYRLPTDDEWSAAIGPGKYPWGDAFPPPEDSGNLADKSYFAWMAALMPWRRWAAVLGEYDDGESCTGTVGSYPANDLGIHDLLGNVWEWCEDEYKVSMNSPDVLKEYRP